jgi:hypothetical protein
MIRFLRWLIGLEPDDVPSRQGRTARWSAKWHDAGGERVSLTPAGARALRLWDEGTDGDRQG